MTLNPWEERALASINGQLTETDPDLAALLDTFGRLAEGEQMPPREAVRSRSRRVPRRPGRARRHSRDGIARRSLLRLAPGQIALLLWVVISLSLIAVGVALSREGSRASCTVALPLTCASSVPSHTPSPAGSKTASSLVPPAR